jgi:hypothetical protein
MEKDFYYNEKKLNSTKIWLLYLFLGWSYGSMDKIGTQILFYLTLGGLGVWGFIRLFTLNKSIKEYNKKIAIGLNFSTDELLKMGLL